MCRNRLLKQIEKLAKAKVDAIVLREKDLSEFEYYDLAKEVLSICAKQKVTCFCIFLIGVFKIGTSLFSRTAFFAKKRT